MQGNTRRHDTAALSIGVGLLILAGVICWDAAGLASTAAYGVGPQAMPIIVAAGLALLAIGNLITAWRGEFPERESYDPKAILLILGGLAALIALIDLGGGFIPAIAILFATTAAAFGRRAFITDLVIGAVLALIVYLLFSKLLSLSLPAGPLENLL